MISKSLDLIPMVDFIMAPPICDIQAFREFCPQFGDGVIWPDETIKRALTEAWCDTGGRAWGDYSDGSLKQKGLFYCAACFLCESAPDKTRHEDKLEMYKSQYRRLVKSLSRPMAI